MTDQAGALTGIVLSGRYQLSERIGQGGMAEVYRAEDLVLARHVAVKILRSQFASDPEFLTRFQQEGRSAARLSHPAIVSVHDVGSSGLAQYIVMDLVEGRDLKAVLRERGHLPPYEAVAIASQVLAGLQHAHQRGLIHRDVKPQNIMIDSDDNARITDFGIARAIGGRQLTATATVIGTAQYVSPEQAMGKPVTPASDVYSLGIVLYELLTGRPPFEGEMPVAVALQHVQEEPIPPRQIDPTIPPGVEAVVMHALAKNPAERYPTAAAMRDALTNSTQMASEATALFAMPEIASVGNPDSRAKSATIAVRAAARRPAPRARTGIDWLSVILGVGVLVLLIAAIPLALRVFASFTAPPPEIVPTPTTRPAIVQTTVPVAAPTKPAAAATKPTAAPAPSPSPQMTPTAKTVTVPSLVGMKLDQARSALDKLGLVALVAEEKPSATDDPGIVLSQDPPQGSSAQPSARISLVVSKATEKVAVPDVVGQTASDARSNLSTVGLKADTTDDWSDTVPAGRVSAQKPAAGDQAVKDSVVLLTISKGRRAPTAIPQVVRPPEGDWAWVPDVVGLPEAEARRRIDLAGLSNTYTNYQSQGEVKDKGFFRSIAPGSVLSVSPNVGDRVPKGSTVYLAVRKP